MLLLDLYKEIVEQGNYHVGKMLLDCLSRKPPDEIIQIDAATGQKETASSVLSRSVQLARSLRQLGLKPGDVLSWGGLNHLDNKIVYCAALFNGMPISGVDPYFRYKELKRLFTVVKPKIAFCQQNMYEDYKKAIEDLGLDVTIVTFDGETGNFAEIMDEYKGNEPVEQFTAAEIETEKIYAWLVNTSGTTGGLKVAAFKHQLIMDTVMLYVQAAVASKISFLSVGKLGLSLSPVQWLTAFFNAITYPVLDICKLQTSNPDDIEHVIDLINEYKPAMTVMSPTYLWRLLNHDKFCDLTCFDTITISGSKALKELYTMAKGRMRPDAYLLEAYGQTETIGPVLRMNPFGPTGSCGVESPRSKIKLIDPETGKEITEPNVPGELWSYGPCFSEYYNDPEATAAAFSPDGWYKTGDLLYRDENGNFFYVQRVKTLIKCRGYHIVPTELEEVITSHPGVQEVCVTSIPHRDDAEHPVACVVRKAGSKVTAQEIKDLVTSQLSASKSLRGGVVFLDKLPMTSSGKPALAKINEIAKTAQRELAE